MSAAHKNGGRIAGSRTGAGELSTIILTYVQALKICGLRAGNIIFDLVFIAPDELTVKDIEQAYDLKSGEVDKARQLLGKAQEQGLSELEINPFVRGRRYLFNGLELKCQEPGNG